MDAAEHEYAESVGAALAGMQPRPSGHQLLLPPGMVIDGAVVELAQHPDGLITADVRIPAHQP